MEHPWQMSRLRGRSPAPFLFALLGAALISAVIGFVQARIQVANLPALYLLLVLWLGSRHGILPAAVASLASFLLYDFFFVPPVGSLLVSGPRELLELGILLAAALITGQLAAALRRSEGLATELATESSALYELATVALRLPEVTGALELLCERARALPLVNAFSLATMEGGQLALVAGDPLDADSTAQATWSLGSRRSLGCVMREGRLVLTTVAPRPARELVVLPLTSGGLVAVVAAARAQPSDLHMLSALSGLADLLLERRRAAVEHERARALEASDRLKAAVLSSISHELKSPLTSLRAGLTALASRGSGVSAEHRALLLGLDGQALRLDRLVGDLLTMSRIEAGGAPDLQPRSFSEIVGGVLGALGPQLGRFQLEVAIPDDLPPVLADELQLDRVLTNLLENAMEFTSQGGRIAIGAEADEDRLVAWVDNTGPQIPVLDLEHVFDKFWTRRATGSGLGLAICKRIVEAHGGTIRARNLREGPRFALTLPFAVVPAPLQ